MSNDCRKQIKACALRVSRLDSNGVPSPGADNLYVSDALVSLSYTVNQTEGTEYEFTNACGDTVYFRDDNRPRQVDVEMQIWTPDPELTELLVGGVVLTDGDAVGYGAPSLNQVANPNGVSVELWARRINDGGQYDSDFPYAWWVWPLMKLTANDGTFENAPHQPTFSGFAVENTNWFDGPANDWPVGSDRVYQWIPTTGVPTTACGYQTLAAS